MSEYAGKTGEVGIVGAGMMGGVGILNVGAGDTKLSFDKSNPAERIRAARIVKDMIRRGYSLLIEVKDRKGKPTGKFVRALDFDENECEYIIADFDSLTAAQVDSEQPTPPTGASNVEEGQAAEAVRPTGRGKKRVPAETTRAVSVGKTSGG